MAVQETPADRTPIDHADPLLAHTLRAGFESYIRGDYHAALDRLLDAQAISRHRADTTPLIALTSTLAGMLDNGTLVSHDFVAPPEDPRRV